MDVSHSPRSTTTFTRRLRPILLVALFVVAGLFPMGADCDNDPAVSDELVDLAIDSLALFQLNGAPDDAVTMTLTVRNVGDRGQSAGSHVQIFLSTNTSVDPGDVALVTDRGVDRAPLSTEFALPPLPQGYVTQTTRTLFLPRSIADGGPLRTGLYHVVAQVTNHADDPDRDTDDNERAALSLFAVESSAPFPADVDIDSFVPTLGQNLRPGATVPVTFVVENNGTNIPAGSPFRVGIFLSSDSVITGGDMLLGQGIIVDGFASGASVDDGGNLTVALPSWLTQGVYYIGLVADYDRAIDESNERNNVSVAQAVVLDAPPPSDLTVGFATLTAPASGTLVAGQDDSITVQYNLTNLEDAPSQGFCVGVFLSADEYRDMATDRLLGVDSFFLQGIGGLETTPARNVTLSVDGLALAGNYYLYLVIDPFGGLDEVDVSNNATDPLTMPISIENTDGGGADNVTLDDLAPGTFILATGNTATVSFDVAFAGAVTETTVRLLLSLDGTPSADDIPLMDALVTDQDVLDNHALELVLPSGITPGTYTLVALADPHDALEENDEGDNADTVTMHIVEGPRRPDLAIVSITPDVETASLAGGDTVQVEIVIENVEAVDLDAVSGRFRVALHLSPDPTISRSDPLVGVAYVDQLVPVEYDAVNEVTLNRLTLTLPVTFGVGVLQDMAAGYYILGAFVDDTAMVSERNETNNRLAAVATPIDVTH